MTDPQMTDLQEKWKSLKGKCEFTLCGCLIPTDNTSEWGRYYPHGLNGPTGGFILCHKLQDGGLLMPSSEKLSPGLLKWLSYSLLLIIWTAHAGR